MLSDTQAMSRCWVTVALVAILSVSGCASGAGPSAARPSVAPSRATAAAPSTPDASPTQADETPPPMKAAADLAAAGLGTVAAADVTLPSKTVTTLFKTGCATVWPGTTTTEQELDREAACLAVIGLAYARYRMEYDKALLYLPHGGTFDVADLAFAQALAVYRYAVGALGSGAKGYFDASLAGLEATLASPPRAPTGLKSLDVLKSAPARGVGELALHRAVHDAMGQYFGALLATCPGVDYPGGGLPACLPFPFSQPILDPLTGRTPKTLIGAIASCEYSPKVGTVVPDASRHNCGMAGVPFWIAYLSTGEAKFWNLLVSVRDLEQSKGGGSTSSQSMIEYVGCYATYVLTPGSHPSCPA